MLSADDIKDLVSGGEGYNVDFKLNVPSKVRELLDVLLFTKLSKALKKLVY